jgi:hypothetical protein
LNDIVSERKERKSGYVGRAFFEYFVTLCAQMVGVFGKIDPKRGQELETLLGKIVEAARTDGVLCGPIPKVVLGQKPFGSQRDP